MNKKLLEFETGLNLSTENIMVQKNDPIVRTLETYFEEIKSIILDTNPVVGGSFRNKRIKMLFARIDEAIYKRFKFRTRTVEDASQVLGVQTTVSNNYNVLAGDVSAKVKNITDILGNKNNKEYEHSDIDTRYADWVKILKVYLQSIKEIDRKLETSSIVVDFERAQVIGYPEKSFSVIVINPVFLLKDLNLTPIELTAAYLHEVGHIFTHFAYMHKSVGETTILIESILEEVGKNKSPLEAIKLSYHKATGDDSISEAKSMVTAVVGITSKYIEEARTDSSNLYAKKDSERLADQFATRFGLGTELVSSLDKMRSHNSGNLSKGVLDTGVLIFKLLIASTIISIFLPALGLFIASFAGGMVLGLIYLTVFGYAFYFLYNLFAAILNKGIDADNPYDSPKRRALMIKNDLVRQLRMGDTDKDTTKAILASIDILTASAKYLDDHNENAIYRVVGSIFSFSNEQKEIRKLDNLVDDLMNNDLHALSAKFNTL